jgi:hypothetical protein
VDQVGNAITFHEPKMLDSLNALLRGEAIRLPDAMNAEQLAAAVRTFVRGAGGFVGSAAFWEAQKTALDMWTSRSPQAGPKSFHSYCQDPVVSRKDGTWTLTFFFFNNQGGVEKWRVSGDKAKISEAVSDIALPNGTFLFPYG